MKKIVLLVGVERYSTYAEVLKNAGYTVLEVQSEAEVYKLWPKPGFGLMLIDETFTNWVVVINWLVRNQYAGPTILLTSKANRLLETCRNNKLMNFNTVVVCDRNINIEVIPSIISTIVEIGMINECELVN